MFLAEQLTSLTPQEREEWIENITNHVQNQGLKSAKVEISHLELAIKECNRTGLDESETIFSVISAYDVPKFKFNTDRKKFELDNSQSSLLPAANFKSVYLADRYTILYQRTIRHELFSPIIPGTTCAVKKFTLKLIENLLSSSKMNEIVILGYLTQFTEGKYYLEDPTGTVPLDMSATQFHNGLVCEGCFVLAEGNYSDGLLKVSGLGFPPAELANSSRAYFGTINSWGGKSKTLLKYSPRLLEIEKSNTDATFIFLSDCLLDNPIVLDKLSSLFNGYNDCPPIAIVLMGPFINDPNNMFLLKQKLNLLADTLQQCARLKEETDIILVPSLDDPSAAKILPRPPLPQSLCKDFLRKVPKTILATNPCRLQYCTQQFVVCRADLVTKFCRNTIHFPTVGQLEDHVIEYFVYWLVFFIYLSCI